MNPSDEKSRPMNPTPSWAVSSGEFNMCHIVPAGGSPLWYVRVRICCQEKPLLPKDGGWDGICGGHSRRRPSMRYQSRLGGNGYGRGNADEWATLKKAYGSPDDAETHAGWAYGTAWPILPQEPSRKDGRSADLSAWGAMIPSNAVCSAPAAAAWEFPYPQYRKCPEP